MYYEINDENIEYMDTSRPLDIKARDKQTEWDDGLVVLIPDDYPAQQEFVELWAPLCRSLRGNRTKKLIRAMTLRSLIHDLRFPTKEEKSLMLTRFIAGIKLEETLAMQDMTRRGDKACNIPEGTPGFTYLEEIIIVMKYILIDTNATAEQKAVVSLYDDLREKY